VNVAVIDYGIGNLASVDKALAFVGATPTRATAPAALASADAIVIPGVGHFAATQALNRDWRQPIRRALERRVPILGICLGMQWLCAGSTEAPDVPGLGVIAGACDRLSGDVKVPHVGWNSLDDIAPESVLLRGLPLHGAAYFTHAYAVPVSGDAVATTTHGRPFASAVERDRVFGVQWHPEKSGQVGLAILTNFVACAAGVTC
jgi:glutamine amidotransferase